ncbi:MAG: cyclodeaminase/cyclohydrolase family protein [bacterium]
MYLNQSIKKYLDDLSSNSSIPGGGSVAALVSALCAGLVSMVANFTLGKEKYQNVESQIKEILFVSEQIKKESEELIDKDTEVYKEVSNAYQLPKTLIQEKQIRSDAIQNALKKAIEVPLKITNICFKLIELNKQIVNIGNKNLISDVGVSILLAEASLKSALLNVEINLKGIKDIVFNEKIKKQIEEIDKKAEEIKNEVLKKIMIQIQRNI